MVFLKLLSYNDSACFPILGPDQTIEACLWPPKRLVLGLVGLPD